MGSIFFRIHNGILLPKLFWPTVRKNCSSDRENFLKFEAEGWEFSRFFDCLVRPNLSATLATSRVSNIESDDSQNVGLEDYNNISDGIFPHFTTPSIKMSLG